MIAAARNTESIDRALGQHDVLLAVPFDVTDQAAAQAAVAAAVERFGSLDVLVLTISSTAGIAATGEYRTAYAASTFGVKGFMEGLASEVAAPFGIKTMLVEPGSSVPSCSRRSRRSTPRRRSRTTPTGRPRPSRRGGAWTVCKVETPPSWPMPCRARRVAPAPLRGVALDRIAARSGTRTSPCWSIATSGRLKRSNEHVEQGPWGSERTRPGSRREFPT
jgi:NAD(P)-dependent dehydrogenase (short-subunit alcohol dehydrogenase family)